LSIFHRHDHAGEDAASEADRFEVLDAEGHIVEYSRADFDMIVETTDEEEVRRQLEHGWVVLAETEVQRHGHGPSGADLIPGIEGLRVGGVPGYKPDTSVTSYTIGFLRDDPSAGSET
jgi:hypothetical protein